MGAVHVRDAGVNGEFAAFAGAGLNEGSAHDVAFIFIEIDKERAPLTRVAPDLGVGFIALEIRRSKRVAQAISIKPDQAADTWGWFKCGRRASRC